MAFRVRWLFVFVCALFASTTTAHPPWNPYDETRFAPVLGFGPTVGVEVVADRITSPLKAVHAPGEPNFLYVVDQPGIVWRVNLSDPNPATNKTVFLDVRSLITQLGVCGPNTFDERGLLGLAFHPNYQKNGKFYTYTSEQTAGAITFPGSPTGLNPDHDNVVSEWQRGPLPVTPASAPGRRELMRVTWPQFNHDGGDLAFGPDGNLYISMGDGGSADDSDGEPFVLAQPRYPQTPDCALIAASSGHQVNGNGQKLNTPLGKILRINVDCAPGMGGTCNSGNRQYSIPAMNPFVNTPGAVKEIWAFGFRNPYRFSFDRGDLYVGDVGQNDIEEVDIVMGGGNYGWNCKEGTKWFHSNGADVGTADDNSSASHCNPHLKFRDPIAQYDTHHEGHSVIGGYVYQGKRVPALRGKYVFGEFSLLFKFPSGPHDYGRLFVINAGGNDGHVDRGRGDGDDGRHGLRKVRELIVLPGSKVSLAVLGIGQDAHGEIYVMGNVSGVPFGENGRVLRLAPPPDPVTDD
jgi:glucose/arabinose dehydrogenase